MFVSAIFIRPIRIDDAADLHQARIQPNVMLYTEGMPALRLEATQQFINSLGVDDHTLVAEVDGKAVGVASLHVHSGKQRHVAHIGIYIHDAYQKQGIGRALLEALLNIADNFLGLIRVELEVYADNTGAISLYESLGFVAEGRKKKARFRNGQYVDILFMARGL